MDNIGDKQEQLIAMLDQQNELTDEQLASILQDVDAVALARENANVSAAVAQRHGYGVDTDAAWREWQAKHEQKSVATRHYIMYTVAAIAASLLLIFSIKTLTTVQPSADDGSYVAFQPTTNNDGITLTSASGRSVTLAQSATDANAMATAKQINEHLNLPEGTATQRLTVSIPDGKSYHLLLPDETEVWLFAGTRLVYPSRFVGEERRVELQGEAYFKVKADAAHPFIIKANQLEARVVGTELAVKNYADEPNSVTLINGKVMVTNTKTKQTVALSPEQKTILSGNRLEVSAESAETYQYWRDGYLYFDDARLADVARSLGRCYNVGVVIENEDIVNTRMRFFCLRSEPLSKAIKMFNALGEFEAELRDNTLYIK